jgi:hypothetical protein
MDNQVEETAMKKIGIGVESFVVRVGLQTAVFGGQSSLRKSVVVAKLTDAGPLRKQRWRWAFGAAGVG